jgi:hypothetical protein
MGSPLNVLVEAFSVVERRCDKVSVVLLGKLAAAVLYKNEDGLVKKNHLWGATVVCTSFDDENMFVIIGSDGLSESGILKEVDVKADICNWFTQHGCLLDELKDKLPVYDLKGRHVFHVGLPFEGFAFGEVVDDKFVVPLIDLTVKGGSLTTLFEQLWGLLEGLRKEKAGTVRVAFQSAKMKDGDIAVRFGMFLVVD